MAGRHAWWPSTRSRIGEGADDATPRRSPGRTVPGRRLHGGDRADLRRARRRCLGRDRRSLGGADGHARSEPGTRSRTIVSGLRWRSTARRVAAGRRDHRPTITSSSLGTMDLLGSSVEPILTMPETEDGRGLQEMVGTDDGARTFLFGPSFRGWLDLAAGTLERRPFTVPGSRSRRRTAVTVWPGSTTSPGRSRHDRHRRSGRPADHPARAAVEGLGPAPRLVGG